MQEKMLYKDEVTVLEIEIKTIKTRTQKYMLESAIAIGEKLTQAKEIVPHGEWYLWLEEKVDFKKSTAENLMKIYKEYSNKNGGLSNPQTFGDLSYSKALTLLAIEENDREKFVKNNDINNASVKDLKEKIKKYKDEKIEIEKEKNKIEEEKNLLIGETNELRTAKENSLAEIEKLKEELNNNDSHSPEDLKIIKELESAKNKLARELEKEKSKPKEIIGNLEDVEKIKTLEKKLKESKEQLQKVKNNIKATENKDIVELNLLLKRFAIDINEVEKTILKIKNEDNEAFNKIKNAAADFIGNSLERILREL